MLPPLVMSDMPSQQPDENKCPACSGELTDADLRCPGCNYGVRPRPYRKRPPPRTLGARRPAVHHAASRMECGFRCPCCGSFGAETRDVLAFDPFSSRSVKPPPDHLAVTCLYCAAVQLFALERITKLPAGLWTAMRNR